MKQVTMVAAVLSMILASGVYGAGGIDEIESYPVWTNKGEVAPSAGITYTQVTDDVRYNTRFYAARDGGGLDTFWYSGGWNSETMAACAGIEYIDLVGANPGVATPPAFRLYGARADGGVDQIWNSGGWNRGLLDGTGWTSSDTVYNAIAHDAITAYKLYCAKEGGGMDIIQVSGDWLRSEVTGDAADPGAVFTALACPPDTSAVVYGAIAGASIYKISFSGSASTAVALTGTNTGATYVSLHVDINKSDWIYGVRDDGNVDLIMPSVSPNYWTVVELPWGNDAFYTDVTTDAAGSTLPGFIKAVKAGPAATCAEVIAQGGGLVSDLNNDCYVEWADFGIFASQWQMTVDPGAE